MCTPAASADVVFSFDPMEPACNFDLVAWISVLSVLFAIRAAVSVLMTMNFLKAGAHKKRFPLPLVLSWAYVVVVLAELVLSSTGWVTARNGWMGFLFGLAFALFGINATLHLKKIMTLRRRLDLPKRTPSSRSGGGPPRAGSQPRGLKEEAEEDTAPSFNAHPSRRVCGSLFTEKQSRFVMTIMFRLCYSAIALQTLLTCALGPAIAARGDAGALDVVMRTAFTVQGVYLLLLGMTLTYHLELCKRVIVASAYRNKSVNKAVRKMESHQKVWIPLSLAGVSLMVVVASGALPSGYFLVIYYRTLNIVAEGFVPVSFARRFRGRGPREPPRVQPGASKTDLLSPAGASRSDLSPRPLAAYHHQVGSATT